MALLSPAKRKEVWARWMTQNAEPTAILKGGAKATMDAIDSWFDANQASLVAALPPEASVLSGSQIKHQAAIIFDERYKEGV